MREALAAIVTRRRVVVVVALAGLLRFALFSRDACLVYGMYFAVVVMIVVAGSGNRCCCVSCYSVIFQARRR